MGKSLLQQIVDGLCQLENMETLQKQHFGLFEHIITDSRTRVTISNIKLTNQLADSLRSQTELISKIKSNRQNLESIMQNFVGGLSE